MDCLEILINNIYVYLTGKTNNKTNIIRVHTRKLEECGELSFPLNISNWRSLVGTIPDIQTIFEYLNKGVEEAEVHNLILKSKSWVLCINKSKIIKNNVHIYLDRTATFKSVIKEVCDKEDKFGCITECKDLNVSVQCDIHNDELNINLSELRLKLLTQVTKNIIHFCGGTVIEDEEHKPNLVINFTLKSSNNPSDCLCGPVLNNKGVKDVITTADDFYKQRTMDMRLMAEHKYGIRITSQPGWSEFFKKLGDAAVIIELLRNKPNHTLTTDINNQLLSSSKGAAFILYNCARLSTLFKEFDKRVSLNIYPKLPDFEAINFNLLIQPEEWDLLYIYILQFPSVINSCVRDVSEGKIYPNCLITLLSSMCLCFSIYYRRVKILIEPKSHLFPTLHARIYLLKALERVLHNGLKILDIQPVRQM